MKRVDLKSLSREKRSPTVSLFTDFKLKFASELLV
ncbi:MAG: hypothetical protein H6Q58_1438 [Firmicutes bacterium]|nr:hypothetical protein [Bacillota bacterium]